MKFLVFQEYPWNSWAPRSTYPWKSCFRGRAYGHASEPARDWISGSLGGEAGSALAQSQVPFTPWTVFIKCQVRFPFHGVRLRNSVSSPYRPDRRCQGASRRVLRMRSEFKVRRADRLCKCACAVRLRADECRKCGEMERALSGVGEEKTNTSLLNHWVVFSFRHLQRLRQY